MRAGARIFLIILFAVRRLLALRRHSLFYGSHELIWARCRLESASDAVESSLDILVLHALDELGNTLQVAVASADELHVVDDIAVHV